MHSQQCVPELSHNQDSSTIPQHIACLQPIGHVGGRLHVLVCDIFYLPLIITVCQFFDMRSLLGFNIVSSSYLASYCSAKQNFLS